ncbi:MAG: hypothetical protein AB7T48_08430 [Solirubrobacterales bacterium]
MRVAALYAELPVFGLSAALLLVAIPAAVVTLMKGRSIWFVGGFVTFGVVWVIAAIALAEPDSWWARTFYDEEQMRRAADPDRHRRPPWLVAAWLGGGLALVAVLGFATARPSAILGVSGSALQGSVDALAGSAPCEHRGERIWFCGAYDDSFSETVAYRVTVGHLGCWTATRVGSPGEGGSKHLSGCITALDYVF